MTTETTTIQIGGADLVRASVILAAFGVPGMAAVADGVRSYLPVKWETAPPPYARTISRQPPRQCRQRT